MIEQLMSNWKKKYIFDAIEYTYSVEKGFEILVKLNTTQLKRLYNVKSDLNIICTKSNFFVVERTNIPLSLIPRLKVDCTENLLRLSGHPLAIDYFFNYLFIKG